MSTLLIACGNPLRGDDGAAHRALELLGAAAEVEVRAVMQLTPELAAEMAGFDTVVFLDAAAGNATVTIAEVREPMGPASLTHVLRPPEIVALASALFGFKGQAFECRIPAERFDPGEGLSDRAKAFAREAARLTAACPKRTPGTTTDLPLQTHLCETGLVQASRKKPCIIV